VISTNKVHLTPLYSTAKEQQQHHGIRRTTETLALPVSLGRKNLAELWWKYCPEGCDAAKKESVPCGKYCLPVRRKSHRELLSRRILDITATAQVQILGRHSNLSQMAGNLESGESCRLSIGKPGEPSWMVFSIQLVRAVTPPKQQATWLQTAERKRETGIRTRSFLLDEDSPSKRDLFNRSPVDDAFSGDPSIECAGTRPAFQYRASSNNRVEQDDALLEHQSATAGDCTPVAAAISTPGIDTVEEAPSIPVHPLEAAAKEPVTPGVASVTSQRPTIEEQSPTLFQSTEEVESDGKSKPLKKVRRRLDFHFDRNVNDGRKGAGKSALDVCLLVEQSPSQSPLSLPMEQSFSEESPMSMQEASEPQWKLRSKSQIALATTSTSCSQIKPCDWERIQSRATARSFAQAIADLVVRKNRGLDGSAVRLPSLLDGAEMEGL